MLDEGVVFIAVGNVGGVGQVDEVGLGDALFDGGEDRKTAESAVEYANHSVHPARVRLLGFIPIFYRNPRQGRVCPNVPGPAQQLQRIVGRGMFIA